MIRKITILIYFVFVQCDNKFSYLDEGLYAQLDTNKGNILMKLNHDKTPITVANFVSLAEGDNKFVTDNFKNKKFYNGIIFHRVIKDFMIQGGDTTNHDGTGGISAFENEPNFNDENFTLKHKKYSISMANSGPNTNGSQFFITLKDTPWLDGKHVVFGNVTKGFDIIDFIGSSKTNDNDKPLQEVLIVDCGEL